MTYQPALSTDGGFSTTLLSLDSRRGELESIWTNLHRQEMLHQLFEVFAASALVLLIFSLRRLTPRRRYIILINYLLFVLFVLAIFPGEDIYIQHRFFFIFLGIVLMSQGMLLYFLVDLPASDKYTVLIIFWILYALVALCWRASPPY